ncbi:SDR family oxidoreductase [Bacteroides sp. 519]|uniref:SDR family oxidoreductase n=1 Tax=Bacteroides sp. 519 TaxID=2302937 RepID=UPI0013D4685F|nr:SDR family oxidoreductase [Bacteroides sp. 519]NDV59788.1 SDR family oxidoreductase [Bacteroides sp. 519]
MADTKVVLLTGGSAGIGLELAILLMEKGVRVYSASRRLSEVRKASSGSGEIIPVQMDVNVESDIQAVISRILKENSRLDAVVCNAGNGIAGSIEDCNESETRFQLETNFFGAVKTIQACLPVFRKQGGGKIMATSSIAAITPIPYQAFYSAGKAALSIFMQALAIETKPFGIQCCTVLPGDTKTEFTNTRKYTIKSQSADSAYTKRMKKAVQTMEKDEKNGMEAKYVATKMAKQLLRKRMKAVVVPGIGYKVIYSIYNLFPLSFRLWVISKIY